ncbi:SRPBCC family protein [Gimesia sp.]|uniref:SRPBCC family protein n=1 Tax=Gimesia sp. TaxID=2024833 RepID=UPI003A92FD5D
MSSNSDIIKKQITLQAPLNRVWKALTDYKEFGAWFGVNLQSPFVAGEKTVGQITIPGYDHIVMEVEVHEIQPETLFSFYWHPYAIDPGCDYSQEKPTLVEFQLKETAEGTLLTVIESGFDAIPAVRRDEAFRMNDKGWTGQIKNIETYLNESIQT